FEMLRTDVSLQPGQTGDHVTVGPSASILAVGVVLEVNVHVIRQSRSGGEQFSAAKTFACEWILRLGVGAWSSCQIVRTRGTGGGLGFLRWFGSLDGLRQTFLRLGFSSGTSFWRNRETSLAF